MKALNVNFLYSSLKRNGDKKEGRKKRKKEGRDEKRRKELVGWV